MDSRLSKPKHKRRNILEKILGHKMAVNQSYDFNNSNNMINNPKLHLKNPLNPGGRSTNMSATIDTLGEIYKHR